MECNRQWCREAVKSADADYIDNHLSGLIWSRNILPFYLVLYETDLCCLQDFWKECVGMNSGFSLGTMRLLFLGILVKKKRVSIKILSILRCTVSPNMGKTCYFLVGTQKSWISRVVLQWLAQQGEHF